MTTSPKQSIAARLLELPPAEALKEFGSATPEQYRALEAEFETHWQRGTLQAHLFAGALVAAVREGVVWRIALSPNRRRTFAQERRSPLDPCLGIPQKEKSPAQHCTRRGRLMADSGGLC
jgi:hypothetical protein